MVITNTYTRMIFYNDLDLGAHRNKSHRNTQREKKMRGKKWKEGQRTLSQVQHSKNEHSFGANI